MREAATSLELAAQASTKALRRLWLDQAWSELERAADAADATDNGSRRAELDHLKGLAQ